MATQVYVQPGVSLVPVWLRPGSCTVKKEGRVIVAAIKLRVCLHAASFKQRQRTVGVHFKNFFFFIIALGQNV